MNFRPNGFSRGVFATIFNGRILALWALTASLATAQYATFAQRQQAYINAALNNYTSCISNPQFGEAEAFFSAGQTTQGLAIVNGQLAGLEANPSNWAGDLQAMISGMDCYYRYGSQWDSATQARFQADYTSFKGYSGETTSNLTMLAASICYLGSQAWGVSAFGSNVYSTGDPTGAQLISSRIQSQVAGGMGEYASRDYAFYNSYPLLVLSQWASDPVLKNKALINYEVYLAQASGTYLNSIWAVASARSYPDELIQQPWGGAEQLWLYFGGVTPSIGYDDEILPAAVAGYQPPAAIVNAATTRTTPFVAQSAYSGAFQYTYMTPNYAVFSQEVAAGGAIAGQIYPFGVFWQDTDTTHHDLLWVTDASYDDSSTYGFHTHGMNGRSIQWFQNNGTILAVRTKSASADPYPYLLGYVPGGYQAAINDAANGRIYLYYNNEVMIAISSYAPFTWDPQGGIAYPATPVYSGDSQFHIPVTTVSGNNLACCAIETAAPTDYPGSTPAQQLAAFQAALQSKKLPVLTQDPNSPAVTYTDHLNQTLLKTYYGTASVNAQNIVEVNSVNGVLQDYQSNPITYNPWVVQPNGGNLVTASGTQETTYDFTNWTITTVTATIPNTPANLSVTRGNAMASLSWTASPGAMSYVVQRATSPTGPYTTVQSNVVPTSVDDYEPANGVTYYYEVAAVNLIGTSAFSAPVAVTPVQTGLIGTYYNNITKTPPAYYVELDPNVYYYWTTTFANGLSGGAFSVQWTGFITVPVSGTYTFYIESQDGADLKINGTTVVNFQGNHPTNSVSGPGTYTFVAGQSYPIVVDYANGGQCELLWTTPSNSTKVGVPTSVLTPAVTAVPANLTAQAANNAVNLGWTASPAATSYNVKRSTTSGSGYVTIGSPAGTSFIDTTAVNGTTYYYVVSAVDGGGESANSTQVSALPQAGIAAAPAGLSATAGNSQVNLSWIQVPGASSYKIYRSTTSGSGYVYTGTTTNLSYTDATAANGTAYYYVVTSFNGSGESGFSSEAGTTPQPPVAQQPTNLVANPGNMQVALNWSAAAGATSYNIYRSSTSDSNFVLIGSSNSTSYTDLSAANGATYYYGVTGVNGGGESNQSLQASSTLIPSAPTSPAATAGTSKVVLTWTGAAGAVSYNIYRSTTNGSGYALIGNATSATFTDSTGTNGTTYYYVITAVNGGGESGYSAQASAAPLPPIATAPTGLIAVPGNTHVGLSWAAASGAATYNVKRSTTSGSGYVTIGNTSVLMFTDSTAVNGTTYYYVVTSVNSGGESGISSQVSTVPQASPAVLPSPWQDQDINTGVVGSASYASSVYTINASGTQIWNTTDGFHFVYRPLIGDGVMIARVKTGGSSYKSGIMMRQGLTANSSYVDAVMNGGPNSVKTEYRATPGASAASASNTPANGVQLSVPYWVKIVRTGNVFTAYRAPDGVTWTQTGGSVTLSLTDPIYVGLVQTSDSNSTLAAATFDNATMLASPTGLAASTVLSTQVNLSWQINPGAVISDATAAQIEVSPTGANTWTVLTSTLAPGTGSYTATNLTAGMAYDFRVKTVGNGYSTPYSTLTNITTTAAAPTNLVAAQSGSSVNLTWTGSASATGYNIKRASISGGPYTTIGTSTTGSSTDATVTAGATYYYVVSATNAGGESLNSNEATISLFSGFQQWLVANHLPSTTSPSAVPDKDGLPLLLKYATNLTPGTPSAAGPVSVSSVGDFLVLQFTRMAPAPVNYLVESSADLANWSPLATLAVGGTSWTGPGTVTESGAGPIQVTVTDTASLSGGTAPRFLRLRVTTSTDTTEPGTVAAGDVPVTIGAGATVATSLPLDNTPLARNAVQAVATSSLTVVNAGNWATASAPCALRLLSGQGSGRTLMISAVNGNALTLASQGVDLTQLVAVGDLYEVLPLDTLGALYGTSAPLLGTGSSATSADNVLLWNGTTWLTYFPNGSSWRQSGSLLTQNNVVLPSGGGFLVTHRGANAVKYQVIGRVPEVALSQYTAPGGSTFLGGAYPLSSTLGATGFAKASGWLAGSSATSADSVLAWNGTTWITFYFNGTNWRQSGSLLNLNSFILSPGQPLMIQRRSSPSALNAFVTQPLPYTQ